MTAGLFLVKPAAAGRLSDDGAAAAAVLQIELGGMCRISCENIRMGSEPCAHSCVS